jgi:hypothetical protein
MDKKLNYLLFFLLAILVATNKDNICQHLGFGQARLHDRETFTDTVTQESDLAEQSLAITLMSDSIFSWEDSIYDFVAVRPYNPMRDEGNPFVKLATWSDAQTPVKVTWRTLTRIEYMLKYYEEISMEMYAPVFSDTLKKLDGKMVEVEGYVIPFEETGTEIALSANPFASCFFCGKGSPASVMSIKLKKKGKKFKMDEYLKFTGRLRLNFSNPKEFYYILEKAEEL